MAELKIINHEYLFDFGENAQYKLKFTSTTSVEVTVVADSYFKAGTINHFEIEITNLQDNFYMITWTEPESSNTVTHVDNFANGISYTNITNIDSKQFWRLKGTIKKIA